MALLAIQERTARAVTRDQHLLTNAHPAVAKTVSTIQVLAWQWPFLVKETVFEFVAPAGAEVPRGGRSSGHAAQENQVVHPIDFFKL
jgi:hypothetical protein